MSRGLGDLTGQRFGKLLVKSFAGKNKCDEKLWKCVCDCGNITTVTQGHLRSGHTTSCGCKKNLLNDLTGKTFGHLTVISRAEDYIAPKTNKRYVQWLCKCICGKETIVTASNLLTGNIKSCGCKNPKRLHNLVGKSFGDLTVLKLMDPYINSSGRKLVRYECECSCGNHILALANTLRSGDVTSCGCKVNSKGEHIVKEFLDNNEYKYEMHKSFKDCLSKKGFRLNFDFYIKDLNLLIECHGIQHYEPIDFFGGNDRYFEQTKHDELKRNYAKTHNYNYLEIDCRKKYLKNIKRILEKYFNQKIR